MTKDEIMAMQPGRELDRLVMEKIFNARKNYYGEEEFWYHYDENGEPDYEWSCYNSPSTDISAAWEVVGKIGSVKVLGPTIRTDWYASVLGTRKYGVWANTAPEAICKAALLAVMV